jgi:thiol-disulfide isomerase/thioredoxin
MKSFFNLILLTTIAFVSYQCSDSQANGGGSFGSSKSLTISGKVNGANGLQVYFDKIGLSPTSASLVQGKTDATPTGEFTLDIPTTPQAGLYRLRFGAQKVNLILDGTESNIKFNGDLATLNTFQYQIDGSTSSNAYKDIMVKLVSRQASLDDVTNFVNNTPNALNAVLVAIQSLGGNREYMNVYNAAKERLNTQYPGSSFINEYDAYLASIQTIKNDGRGFQMIAEEQRQPAPDINLPSPDGKKYALSDLKGKVVLVDFWASWCRPCRMENPNVVKVYNKYKDKGFTVFSVSLDGLDSRAAARYNGDAAKLAEAIESQKKRWVDAINADGLVWDTHVSDLKKWECAPARAYGVSSIPRTFMIDKNGKIAAMNLRGEQVEEVLLELL